MIVKYFKERYYLPKRMKEELKKYFILKKVYLSIGVLLSLVFVFSGTVLFGADITTHFLMNYFGLNYLINMSAGVLIISGVLATLFYGLSYSINSSLAHELYFKGLKINKVPKDFTHNGKTFKELMTKAEEEGIEEATCKMIIKLVENQEKRIEIERAKNQKAVEVAKRNSDQVKLNRMMDNFEIEESSRIEITKNFNKNKDYGEVTRKLLDIVDNQNTRT